ncbi:MAG TPA: DUF6152 family protein [Gammaproteobacteria bacterium]|jgi:hypothetical protein|nr:DUF6152 family protein [Gammaproteobacteria bacterium]
MTFRHLVRAAAAGVLMAGLPVAFAHHGIANFDLNKDVSINGTVKRLAFVNPHSWLYVNVPDANGTVTEWRCEMRSATVLRRSGWSASMFMPGTQLRVTGAPDRHDPNTCYLSTITFADGTTMDRYGQLQKAGAVTNVADRPARLPTGEPNLNGDWAGEQRVMTDRSGLRGALVPLSVADKIGSGELPAGVRAFPGARGTPESLAEDAIHTAWVRPSPVALTEAGRKAAEGFDPSSTANPRLRCEPTNILFDWTFETFTNRITQDENAIRIQYGAPGIDRTIHLHETSHPGNIEPSVTGHSIGHWENDVLVVDTVGFKPGVLSADTLTMHSGQLHVVERFTLDAAKGALRREYVAEDPLYFSGQYKGADTVYLADLPYETPSCEDLSYATDRGTRAAERSEAQTAPQPAAPAARPWWLFWKDWF